ncbi:hypothetical protein LEP1GSC170_0517, partial [Leptospira interrogans serovar Bataviae str. HAI135]
LFSNTSLDLFNYVTYTELEIRLHPSKIGIESNKIKNTQHRINNMNPEKSFCILRQQKRTIS